MKGKVNKKVLVVVGLDFLVALLCIYRKVTAKSIFSLLCRNY